MRIPVATYRLQLNSKLRFEDVQALVPYLSDLGIGDIYASPIFRATGGSTHGYDVTDPNEVNPELGTWEDFASLTEEVRAHQMGWLQDIVPNHMAYSSENRMLMDVFEHGPRSRFYEFFDIFHDHPDPELRTRVLTPFLGSPLEEVLRRGEMQLRLDSGGLAMHYFNWRFPVCLASYDVILKHGRERMSGSIGGDDPQIQAFSELRDSFAPLSEMGDSPAKHRQLAEAKEALVRLHDEHPMIRLYLDGVLESFNRKVEGPIEQSPLYRLLERQFFKPVFWHIVNERINYRRFFYLSDFISLRIEDPRVFHKVHGKVLELARAGVFTGLRIDHIDGLHNPREYLVRLHNEVPDSYIVVEKILELYEFLPTEWPVQGTSGYKFCNILNGVFCKQEHEQALTEIYHEFIGSEPDCAQLLYEEKRKILEQHMAGEIEYLAHLAAQAADEALDVPGLDPEAVRRALISLMAAFPVYRTYVDAYHSTEQDRRVLAEAIEKARDKCPECRPDVDRIVALLLSALRSTSEPAGRQASRYFLMRFQQFTGPAMAKGFEDTLLYVYNRFISLNEVGGDPKTFGLSLDRFHRFNQLRARNWPHAMSSTSTHDSKRGEDVRARLNVLSEIPERWQQTVTRWAKMNECHKQRSGDLLAPDRNDEYLLYQTLVGAMPFEEHEYDSFTQRIKDYLIKAVREAKTHSNWVQPNQQYEDACLQFIDRILNRSRESPFWFDFLPFQREVAGYGVYNSLSQTTLKMMCPGLPDFYQGSELWDLNLVDPDNRRPVDFQKRARFLKEVVGWGLPHRFLSPQGVQVGQAPPYELQDGRIKLFLIAKGLRARGENKGLFERGDYLPGLVTGRHAEHVVAFFRVMQPGPARREPVAGGAHALVVVPRFLTALVKPGELPLGRHVWEGTGISLPEGAPSTWQDAITGKTLRARGEIPVGDILAKFPVSILVGR